MSTDKEREAFEHYFSDGGKSPRSVERGADGKYLLGSAHNAWRVWQARAAMAPAGDPANWRTVAAEALAWMEGAWGDSESQFGTDSISLDERIAMGEEQEIAAMRRIVSAPQSPATDRAEVLRLFAEYRSMMVQAVAEASQGNDITAGSLELAAEDAAGELVRLLGGE